MQTQAAWLQRLLPLPPPRVSPHSCFPGALLPKREGEGRAKKRTFLLDFFLFIWFTYILLWWTNDAHLARMRPTFSYFYLYTLTHEDHLLFSPRFKWLAKSHMMQTVLLFASHLCFSVRCKPHHCFLFTFVARHSICHSVSEQLQWHHEERSVLGQMAHIPHVASFFLFLSKCHNSACLCCPRS